jgi:hypothetical protein
MGRPGRQGGKVSDGKGHVLVTFDKAAIGEVTGMVPPPASIMVPHPILDDLRMQLGSGGVEISQG